LTALWEHDGTEWQLIAPTGFMDERGLQSLVEEAPQMLPLSGSPELVVVGREVQLGSGYADLLAVESSGRLAVIEVKLARNAEARRAVVAQALAYAAYLNELDAETFETDVIGGHVRSRGWSSLEAALAQNDQSGTFDPVRFREGLDSSFATGSFRLVFVLDQAPSELVRLVGYLESVTERLTIDLVGVAAYDIGGSKVLVPQRVDPERAPREAARQPARARAAAAERSTPGATEFEKGIGLAPAEQQEPLRKLARLAKQLEDEGLARLTSFKGVHGDALLPRLLQEGVGLVTIWNQNGAALQFWRSVFERRAPEALARIESVIAPLDVRQGNTIREIEDALVDELHAAYLEASRPARVGFDWSKVRAAVEAIPEGRWTTYGDLAELAGTSAIAVGRYIASTTDLKGAYRVLGADGKPRPDFRWSDPDEDRDVIDVLSAEGIALTPAGAAEEAHRLRKDELEALLT
jgi:alkylated DNA nucleotide flippase Atl1